MTFFECQTELPQSFPQASNANLHIVFRHEPGLQFGKRRIGFAHDAGAKSFVMRDKLRFGATCPRGPHISVFVRRAKTLSIEETLTRNIGAAA